VTPDEKALVLAALIGPLRRLPIPAGSDPPGRVPPPALDRLAVDRGTLDALLDNADTASPAAAALAGARRDIEASPPLQPGEEWRPAPNPFAPVQLGDGPDRDPARLPIAPLSAQSLLGEHSGDDLHSILDRLRHGCNRLWADDQRSSNFEQGVWSVIALLNRYLWFAPWSPALDLPLPQTARLLAAAALCRYRADSGSLFLITGDFSGIQRYILSVTTAQDWSGAARRLRARSLHLQLLADVAGHRLLHTLDLSPANLILSAGSRFAILAPRTDEVSHAVDRRRAEWERWLFAEMEGEIQLQLSCTPAESGDLPNAGAMFARANAAVSQQRLQSMRAPLRRNGQWDPDAFVGQELAGVCNSCGRGLRPNEGEPCRHCRADEAVGRQLPSCDRLAYRTDADGLINVLGYSVDLLPRGARPAPSSYLVAATSLSFGDDTLPVRALATHIPMEGGRPITFEDLAQRKQRGRPYLGYLKADVDNLGTIFAWGLRRDGTPGLDALPRLMAISDVLEWFFAGSISELTKQPPWENIYIVFAGGDDLLAIGPWELTLELAAAVRHQFGALTAGNPSVTLSAGYALSKARYPVAQMVRQALRELERAKGELPERGEPQGNRDSLGLLRDALRWHEWRRVQQPRALLMDESTTSAMLRVLLECARLWHCFQQGDMHAARYVPLLTYTASRNVDPRRQRGLHTFIQQLLRFPPPDDGAVEWNHLGTLVKLAGVARAADRT
jgi:CRISPR-associated protein Csm1